METRDLCSPSVLNLRFHCPGSAAMYRTLPQRDDPIKSDAAERGTRLHAVTAGVLQGSQIDSFGLPREDIVAVEWCLEKINDVISRFDVRPIIKYEYQIDLSELGIYGGREGCRIDIIFVIPGIGSIVIDLKYGASYVAPPRWNKQFQGYAWGAWRAFGGNVECIKLQPAAHDEEHRYQACLFDESDFERIGAEIKDAVALAKSENAPLIRGQHCEYLYCKAKEICPLHRQAVLEIPQGVAMANYLTQISPAERKSLYENLQTAQKWCEHAIEIVQSMAIQEKIDVAGYHVGEGKRYFAWVNEVEAEEKIREYCVENKIDVDTIIEPAHLVSKSKIQEIIGQSKKAKALIEPLLCEMSGQKCLKRDKQKG